MPIYVYQCDSCGVTFERQQHFSDEPLTDCPECDGHLHRIIQPVGIVFKGSGFYVTDNRAKSSTALPGEAKGKKEETSSTSDSNDSDS
jgi:putative FmdB family regulatory protein